MLQSQIFNVASMSFRAFREIKILRKFLNLLYIVIICCFINSNVQFSDFLLNPFFAFRNDLYVNLLYDMYTCCYTKMI